MNTAVEQFWKEISEIIPCKVDSVTALKVYDKLKEAKEMERQEKIEFACDVYDKYNFGPQDISFREECEQFKSE